MAASRRGVVRWLLVGCAGCLVAGAGGVAGLAFVLRDTLTSTEPYKQSVARLEKSQAAKDALGAPISTGWIISGNVSLSSGGTGNADLSVPVHGPKGKGTLIVKSTRKGGHWEYEAMRVEIPNGPTVDLLTDSEEESL